MLMLHNAYTLYDRVHRRLVAVIRGGADVKPLLSYNNSGRPIVGTTATLRPLEPSRLGS
jgi:hypothetical protein